LEEKNMATPEKELLWLRQEQDRIEKEITIHQRLLTHLKLDLETTRANIGRIEKQLVALRKPVTKCSCGKEAPESSRLVTGGGGVYCLDCGYEILNLLRNRNDKKEYEQTYKEFYNDILKKQNAQAQL
jgi:hypothetical protein